MPHILYFASIALFALVSLLFENDILPRAIVANTPAITYALNLLCIVTASGGTFLLLYWWRIPAIAARRTSQARRMHIIRILLCAFLILVNILVYYLAPYTHNALNCILILLIAGIFCWPNLPLQNAHQKMK